MISYKKKPMKISSSSCFTTSSFMGHLIARSSWILGGVLQGFNSPTTGFERISPRKTEGVEMFLLGSRPLSQGVKGYPFT